MTQKIIYYGLKNEEEEVLKNLGENWEFISPNQEDLHQKVGYIAGLDGYQKEDLENVTYPENSQLILFVNPNKEELYHLLQMAKEEGYIFPHKAIMTETTKDWQFSYLLGHILEEHRMVQAYRKLGVLVKQAQSFLPHEAIEREIQKAKDLPKLGEDLTTEIVEEVYNNIEGLIETQKSKK
ncbi:MAG: DUF3783 domain-containing protein [Tissierellia bacterium]|nr:DUF3783 domain-containing protein [Tissierellia bacterium]